MCSSDLRSPPQLRLLHREVVFSSRQYASPSATAATGTGEEGGSRACFFPRCCGALSTATASSKHAHGARRAGAVVALRCLSSFLAPNLLTCSPCFLAALTRSTRLEHSTPACSAAGVAGHRWLHLSPCRNATRSRQHPYDARRGPVHVHVHVHVRNGVWSQRTSNGRALVRVGAAWQAATYLPPAHINAHERSGPLVIRPGNGRGPS